VVSVPLIGLDGGQGAVGDEGVVAVGREQFALRGAGCDSLIWPRLEGRIPVNVATR